MAQPFLRYLGGKRKLAARLASLIHVYPFRRYFEPFVGAGALFFHLQETPSNPSWASFLSDSSPELIDTYVQVRDNQPGVAFALADYLDRGGEGREEEFYYHLRDKEVPASEAAAAARYIYLNQGGFNGCVRVNADGKNNVPVGRDSKKRVRSLRIDFSKLEGASRALQGVKIEVADFEKTIGACGKGDLVYADSPYIGGHVQYTKEGWSSDDVFRLAVCCIAARKRGAVCVVSQPDHPVVRQAFDARRGAWDTHEVVAARSVSRDGDGRGKVQELILVGGPL